MQVVRGKFRFGLTICGRSISDSQVRHWSACAPTCSRLCSRNLLFVSAIGYSGVGGLVLGGRGIGMTRYVLGIPAWGKVGPRRMKYGQVWSQNTDSPLRVVCTEGPIVYWNYGLSTRADLAGLGSTLGTLSDTRGVCRRTPPPFGSNSP